ncbi:putative baseplate assembly protein V [Pseudomonas phage PPpW-3]|uniref:Putative baseplate assembly protein V n=1 Tax=Pseudomonas phage PPpW-3 TaxID=1279082 RepID=V5YUM9_9CAUD|nr:baseplate assembly protein [Pseudomonas phage PPpW-3]BAO20611.1 putative baseplate assembly protein V [Pseudomonas phage PPpW-3]
MNEYDATETQRILSNLIRIGKISALDETTARVKVDVAGLTTDWLPWAVARAGSTRTWSAPRIGEQVVVLSPHGDPAQGVVMPSLYQDAHPAPASSKDQETIVYPDGTSIDYNSATNTYTMTVVGNAQVTVICKNATIKAATSVRLEAPSTTVTGNLAVGGALTVTGNATISGSSLTHAGKNVGSTHRHTGVTTGSGTSGAPS